jgi:inner membrane transporter RhtA
MTTRSSAPPWSMAVTAMLSVQLGAALSVPLIAVVGPAGSAWLRYVIAAVVLLALARPPLRSIRPADVPIVIGLGMSMGVLTIASLAAIERIPLGTAAAIGFLGPLTVAAVRSHSRRALVWPALALVGVVLLTQPWQGEINALGVAFAAASAVGWGAYILLTQQIGDRFSGLSALSLTFPIAAITAAFMGVPQAAGHLSVGVIAASAGLALLVPILPYALELQALRRMTPHAFGTLMALEPAFAVIIGALILQQIPGLGQVLGIALVVLAGAAAQQGWRGRLQQRAVDDGAGGRELVGQ